MEDWGWGGQLYWTIQLFGKSWGSQGVRQDETSIDEASYYFQYWWWHNGAHVDSWSSDESANAAVQSAPGPTKANAAKLMAPRPRLMTSPEPEPCNPQPALAMRGGVDALLYLTNASARAASDQSMLVCRMGADGAWGAVETPWDDGTADLSPSVGVADDGTVVAAWVNLKGQVGEPTQLTDVTRQMEIAVGVRNPSTGAWTCRNLTADDQVDFSPRVAVAADGTAYVAWCANGDNAFYGSNTVVKCVKFASGAWGSEVSLGKVGSVNGLAVACRGAKGAIACTADDGEASKMRCFEVSGGSVVQSATVVGASWVENPEVSYSADGVARFHWIQDGELRTKGGFAAGGDAVAEGAAGVTVPHGAAYLKGPDGVQGLVWQEAPKANGDQNGVMLMARDASGKWQAPATLWIPEERNGAFSGAYAADGTLRLAYESASGSRDDKGVMRYGAASLKTFELGAGVDVSVTANEIGIDGERLFFGVENEFVATIHNLGRTDAVNVPVKFVAAANGATNEFFSTVTDIVAGGCVCLTSKWTVAEGYADLVLRVLLDPEETLADANRANNAAEWRPKAGALAIVDERAVRETRTVCQVNAKVVTDGALVIPEGTVVEYRRGGANGELLATDTLGEIAPGKGYSTGFRWDMSATPATRARETVYLKIRGCDHAIAAVDVMTTLDTDGGGENPPGPDEQRETQHFNDNGATSGSIGDSDGSGRSTKATATVVSEAKTHVDVEKGEVAPYETAAATYDGYLHDGDSVVGSVQVKVAKMKNGEAKVTATVQLADGSKKISFKGGVADATGRVTGLTAKGHALEVSLGVNGLGGALDGKCQIDGARNVFGAKDAAAKAAAAAVDANWAGRAINVVCGGDVLSVSIAKKGKVKVSGMANGVKVSATSQLLVGETCCCIPVVITKKANLAFTLWLADGGIDVVGLGDGAVADMARPLRAGAKFWFGAGGAPGGRALPGLLTDYLPDGLSVAQSGKKWIVADGAKAGQVTVDKSGMIDEAKLGANPSGLKLSYTEKSGSFKGSFKVYNLENGKVKAYAVSVTGVMIGDVGYGTATIKKPTGSWPVEVK